MISLKAFHRWLFEYLYKKKNQTKIRILTCDIGKCNCVGTIVVWPLIGVDMEATIFFSELKDWVVITPWLIGKPWPELIAVTVNVGCESFWFLLILFIDGDTVRFKVPGVATTPFWRVWWVNELTDCVGGDRWTEGGDWDTLE